MVSRNQNISIDESTLTTEDLDLLTKYFLENLCSCGDVEDQAKGGNKNLNMMDQWKNQTFWNWKISELRRFEIVGVSLTFAYPYLTQLILVFSLSVGPKDNVLKFADLYVRVKSSQLLK